MSFLLLGIIASTYIAQGMQNELLGAAWPSMILDFNVPESYMSLLTMATYGVYIIASLVNVRLVRKVGVGRTIFFAILAKALMSIGYALSPSFVWLFLMTLPIGFSSGTVDPSLNNYLSVNYKPRYISWLHCMWSGGSVLGPLIMAIGLAQTGKWQTGYYVGFAIMFVISAALLAAIPLWNKVAKTHSGEKAEVIEGELDNKGALRKAGVKAFLIMSFFQGALGPSISSWTNTFLVGYKALEIVDATSLCSLIFIGQIAGRILCGILTIKFKIRTIMRMTLITCSLGTILLFLPVPRIMIMAGLFLMGLGYAPIYSCMIADTATRFGKHASRATIALLSAASGLGGVISSPIFGVIEHATGIWILPFVLVLYMIVMAICSESSNRASERAQQKALLAEAENLIS